MAKKEKKLLVSFVLDETGSMMKVKDATIEGFNAYIQTLREDDSASLIRFTLTHFNSNKVDVRFAGVKLKAVPLLTPASYQPAAMTPLYDAVGQTIRATEQQIADKKNPPDVLLVIQTDGLENYSREYDQKGIFDLIREKRQQGWTFVFLAADLDAWQIGSQMGLTATSSTRYDGSVGGTRTMYAQMARQTSRHARRRTQDAQDFFEEDD